MSIMALKIHAPSQKLRSRPPTARKMCGCFNCMTIFEATDSFPSAGLTFVPTCPNCGKDTVLDGATVPSLDTQLLDEINGYWFAQK